MEQLWSCETVKKYKLNSSETTEGIVVQRDLTNENMSPQTKYWFLVDEFVFVRDGYLRHLATKVKEVSDLNGRYGLFYTGNGANTLESNGKSKGYSWKGNQ